MLKLRQALKDFYKGYDVYILPVLKFLIALALFYYINSSIGYMEMLNSMFVVLILSLICAILPINGTVVFGVALIILHCFGIGMEAGLFSVCLYLVLVILFLRFSPKDSIAVLITPLAFSFGIPAVIPISLGLRGKTSSAVTAVCSVISYFFIKYIPFAAAMKEADELSSLEQIQEIMKALTDNNEMLLYVIVFVAILLIVHLIRRQLMTYGWLVSILTGGGLYIFLSAAGAYCLEMETDLVNLIIGTVISIVIALVIAFFFISVNYKASRYMQFEDDDFYYYVKAIPKNKTIDYEEEPDEIMEYFESEKEEDFHPYEEAKHIKDEPTTVIPEDISTLLKNNINDIYNEQK